VADQNPHRDRSRGISVYTQALARRGDVELACIASPSSLQGPASGPPALRFRSDHLLGRVAADQLHDRCGGVRADLWHYPKGFLPLFGRGRAPRAGTLHDTIVDWYAQHLSRAPRGLRVLARCAREAAAARPRDHGSRP
jgi:hypothetical protein